MTVLASGCTVAMSRRARLRQERLFAEEDEAAVD
jgi:hypothetical protein